MTDLLEVMRERWEYLIGQLNFGPGQKKTLAAIFAAVIIGSVLIVTRSGTTPVEAPAPLVIAPVFLTVDVAGGVKKPGVYSLSSNSRVVDAIAAAGGANPGTDLSDINMARIVKDGEQIYVEPLAKQTSGTGRVVRLSIKKSGPLNINRASLGEFDSLPGIGPVIAARIMAYRKSSGPFSAIEDLLKVSGIGPSKFAQFKSKVRV